MQNLKKTNHTWIIWDIGKHMHACKDAHWHPCACMHPHTDQKITHRPKHIHMLREINRKDVICT